MVHANPWMGKRRSLGQPLYGDLIPKSRYGRVWKWAVSKPKHANAPNFIGLVRSSSWRLERPSTRRFLQSSSSRHGLPGLGFSIMPKRTFRVNPISSDSHEKGMSCVLPACGCAKFVLDAEGHNRLYSVPVKASSPHPPQLTDGRYGRSDDEKDQGCRCRNSQGRMPKEAKLDP